MVTKQKLKIKMDPNRYVTKKLYSCTINGKKSTLTGIELDQIYSDYLIDTKQFRCAICDTLQPDNKGMFIPYDKNNDVKVCNIHIPYNGRRSNGFIERMLARR